MIINDFKPAGGHHCITNSLKQIFEFNNYPISEPMLFGLGSCLGFVYINLASSPLISGRIKTNEAEKNLFNRLNIKIKTRTPVNYDSAFHSLRNSLSRGIPVMIYVDMVYLKYLNLYPDSHFGGHSVVVFGFDDNEGCFYVSDRDNNDFSIHTPEGKIAADFHKVPFEEMEKARNSSYKPFPAKNKWLDFDFTQSKPITQTTVYEAIGLNAKNMLNPPAKLLGINGIRKFANEIKKWKKFDSKKFKLSGITNYFMINADGGTGGGAFRTMFGNFLIESSEITGNKELAASGKNFIEIGRIWDEIGLKMMNIYKTGNTSLVDKLSTVISVAAEKEETELEKLLTITG